MSILNRAIERELRRVEPSIGLTYAEMLAQVIVAKAIDGDANFASLVLMACGRVDEALLDQDLIDQESD